MSLLFWAALAAVSAAGWLLLLVLSARGAVSSLAALDDFADEWSPAGAVREVRPAQTPAPAPAVPGRADLLDPVAA